MRILNIIYSLIVTIFLTKDKPVKPVRLEKPTKKSTKKQFHNPFKKINITTLLIYICVTTVLILVVYITFKTGSMESTTFYNNRLV